MNKFKTMAEVWKYLDEHGIKSDIELVQAFNYVYEFALNDAGVTTDKDEILEITKQVLTVPDTETMMRRRRISEQLNRSINRGENSGH